MRSGCFWKAGYGDLPNRSEGFINYQFPYRQPVYLIDLPVIGISQI
jgi:hypothetical protein